MDYNNLSDVELVNRLKHDDRIAFEVIYKRYVSDLYRYLNVKIDSQVNCDEMIIDVFVGLWVDRYNDVDDLKSHLTRLCRFRLAVYAHDNPSSTLSKHLKQLLHETHEEKNNSKSKI